MSIALRCAQCQKQFRVGEELVGARVKCPNCGHLQAVAAPTSSSARAVQTGSKSDTATDIRAIADKDDGERVIRFQCPNGHEITMPQEYGNQRVECPHPGCGQVVRVPLETVQVRGSMPTASCGICGTRLYGPAACCLLTTRQVVGEAAYWQRVFEKNKPRWKELGVTAYDAFCQKLLDQPALLLEHLDKADPWLVCDDCFLPFLMADGETAHKYSYQWWNSKGTFRPPGCGPAPADVVRVGPNPPWTSEQLSRAVAEAKRIAAAAAAKRREREAHSAVCDVCSTDVHDPDGHLLTTKQVVRATGYWNRYYKQHSTDLKQMGIRSYQAFCDKADSIAAGVWSGGDLAVVAGAGKAGIAPLGKKKSGAPSLRAAMAGQSSPWLVCEDCVGIFDVNPAKTREYAREWWKSAKTFEPPGAGPAAKSDVNMIEPLVPLAAWGFRLGVAGTVALLFAGVGFLPGMGALGLGIAALCQVDRRAMPRNFKFSLIGTILGGLSSFAGLLIFISVLNTDWSAMFHSEARVSQTSPPSAPGPARGGNKSLAAAGSPKPEESPARETKAQESDQPAKPPDRATDPSLPKPPVPRESSKTEPADSKLDTPASGSEDMDQKIQEWAKALKYGEEARLVKACREIAKAGPEAKKLARELCRVTTDRSPLVRQAALEAVEKVRPDLYPHLVVWIARDNIKVKATLASLAQMGETASDMLPVLLFDFDQAKNKKNEAFLSEVAYPLAKIGGGELPIVKLIIASVPIGDGRSRASMLRALAVVAEEHEAMRSLIVPVLRAPLSGNDYGACLAAIQVAEKCGYQAKEHLPVLRKLKLASAQEVRAPAAHAIEIIEMDKPEEKATAQKPEPPASDAETRAANKLKQAKALLDDNKKADAYEFCEEIIKKYPGTKAAEEAKEMMESIKAKK